MTVYRLLSLSLFLPDNHRRLITSKANTVYFAALNIIGVATVLYWAYTEHAGQGDLRWSAIVQFFPLIAVLIIMWLFSPILIIKEILLIFLFFLLAKLSETYDKEIYLLLRKVISWHSLKHLLMAGAGYGINTDNRAFAPINERDVLALQLTGNFYTGNVPFNQKFVALTHHSVGCTNG